MQSWLRVVALALPILLTVPAGAADPVPASLQAAVASPARSPDFASRDKYRKPAETLAFAGVKNDQTVIELWPFAGYWSQILGPYLAEKGRYIAAVGSLNPTSDNGKASLAKTRELVKGKGEVIEFNPKTPELAVAPGSVDEVLTFRNLHNWMAGGTEEAALAAIAKALKPGGTLVIEDHRGPTDKPQDPKAKSGYVREDYAIALAEKAGFKLAAKSELYANPKDTKDYAEGVWTLPPTFTLKDQDRAKYEAIGESDRFLLRFTKS